MKIIGGGGGGGGGGKMKGSCTGQEITTQNDSLFYTSLSIIIITMRIYIN